MTNDLTVILSLAVMKLKAYFCWIFRSVLPPGCLAHSFALIPLAVRVNKTLLPMSLTLEVHDV